MSVSKYSLSYTTGAALIPESIAVATLQVELEDWSVTQMRVLEENCFQARTLSTLRKLYGEVARRLKHLTPAQLQLLSVGTDDQAKALLWVAICSQYAFIRDFTIEVMAVQYSSSRFLLTHDDYDAFFNAKAEWHNNLDRSSKSTKSKARQVLFKMLKECGLINEGNEILKQRLSKSLAQLIANDNSVDLRVFPGLDY